MRPALQGIAADAKSAFLGGGGKGLLGREDLATWEIRGRLVATPGEPPRIDLEGGFRIDAAEGTSFWALGAEPGGAALVRRAESVPPLEGRGWADLAARRGAASDLAL